MTANGILQLVAYLVVLILITKPMGVFLTKVFRGERTILTPFVGGLERLIYRLCGIHPETEMKWTAYSGAMLIFSAVTGLVLYGMLRFQHVLPWNPQGFGAVAPDLSFGTAMSFTTNTNWQAYSGETTMSYFTQMAGLAFHNFASAAVGIAIALAVVRGLVRSSVQTIGNFWVDLVRCTLYVLLPMSIVATIIFIATGMIQNLSPYVVATTLEGAKQTIAMGPVASQEAIKILGTNGGGFFNANSAHPFENPSALTNFIQVILIFSIGSGLTYMFGRMAKDQKQGWAIWGAMTFLFLAGLMTCYTAEQSGNPITEKLGIQRTATDTQPGGNMEGKEVRFGIAQSTLFATVTTDASCGAVNSMHESYTPIGGMVTLFNILLGEVIFGGVGAGLYGMMIFVILSVFIAGLMVGRTPEYLGKKIESKEVKLSMLALLSMAFCILGFTAWAVVNPAALKSLANAGPHGLTEILYAFASATGNNGSAFAGLSANTQFYNLTQGLSELVGRFFVIVPMLAVAGSMARKTAVAPSSGTFLTNTPLFSTLLVMVIIIVAGLTFFPALSLGPILEHLLMGAGKLF
ncbi:MAG: potassium-transporting ATPase subunit KdpA [Bacteroidota bacterium]|nr:potassium-transporting ATPase subunit KdpA [Bacteroidota bacterium]MDP4233306.1 potassium-transporting ATPase subunit KdpA [Bacteroidota bacterium]MDP4242074.1 potassium-transporting ATPase subunit KdpA [Bacteroidota bacterium]MDP4288648.1 potassium-transporting ATPase subunit KdpA [Bacteroidota bacterium]